MDNVLRVVLEAVDSLEEYLPDLPDCIENESERKKVLSIVNRLLRLGTETKERL